MALQHTALTLTPTWKEKGLRVTGGMPAVREKVILTLVGAAQENGEGSGEFSAPEGLAIRVFPANPGCVHHMRPSGEMSLPYHPLPPRGFDYARFPLTDEDAWEVDGQDLKCVLDLNTENLLREFRFAPAECQIDALVTVESGAADNLYAIGRISIQNWHIDSGDPVPGSTILKRLVDSLFALLSSHAHKGTDEDPTQKISHTDLADKGTWTHPEIETRINTHTANTENPHHVTLEQVGGVSAVQVEAKLSAHNASGSAHTDIRNLIKAETDARETAVASLAATVQSALNDKQGKPPASVLAAIAALDDLPVVFTENQMRQKMNEIIAILKGAY